MSQFNHLIEFATTRQIEYIEAMEKFGSYRKAAKHCGVGHDVILRSLRGLKRRAALQGEAPEFDMTKKAPEGFLVKGTSTYYDEEGKLRGQWVKTTLDMTRAQEIITEAVAAMCEDIPRQSPLAGPTFTADALCNLYVMTDCHVGMLADDRETKSGDWDIKIAEQTLIGCFERMVMQSAPSSTAVIAQLGDFLHYDSILGAVTPTSGHALDSDSRLSMIVRAALRILRRLVNIALQHHKHVVVLMAEGNHDLTSSVWLRAMFQALYENEPRITVIDSELPYYVHQHGETMLAFHHGHLKKNDQLPLLFAAQFPKVWGSTSKRYCHTGHLHHIEEKEHPGMTVTQHPTLASRDAYAARGGWIAERQVTSTTYHSKTGRCGTVTITPEMLALH